MLLLRRPISTPATLARLRYLRQQRMPAVPYRRTPRAPAPLWAHRLLRRGSEQPQARSCDVVRYTCPAHEPRNRSAGRHYNGVRLWLRRRRDRRYLLEQPPAVTWYGDRERPREQRLDDQDPGERIAWNQRSVRGWADHQGHRDRRNHGAITRPRRAGAAP